VLDLTTNTFARPADLSDRRDPAVLFARSYLAIRTAVGVLGILLPVLLVSVDALLLEGPVTARDSLSDYYHSGARDVFVGALCIIGGLLVTYLAPLPRTWDFWLSAVAGVAAFGVAFFPTFRAEADAPFTPLQERLGATPVAVVHFASAGVFLVSMAALSFVFAARDRRWGAPRGRVLLHRACGSLILAALAWAALGFVVDLDLGWVTALYAGEVVAVWSFGVSWLVKGADLWQLLRRSSRG
jgi:hypothetical protein